MAEKKSVQIEIGQKLQEVKEEIGITGYRLAKETKLGRGQISAILGGVGNPTIKTVDKVCKALGCELKIEKK